MICYSCLRYPSWISCKSQRSKWP